jgi:uncharacterized protein YyaL (SSP411 family)
LSPGRLASAASGNPIHVQFRLSGREARVCWLNRHDADTLVVVTSAAKTALVGGLAFAAIAAIVMIRQTPKPATETKSATQSGTKPESIVSTNASAHAHTNRLAREKSPYLLQHQHNPVDWFPWGDDAFKKARAEDKPIFLSIGYSTCHWCHVMERESFENEKVAEFLNQHFVSIKVDREERPDVDKIYMTAVQAMSGSGGWPLNSFLAPDLKPFYGGTYFPPDNRYGRPGFLELLQRIVQIWQTRRADLAQSATNLHEQLAQITSRHEGATNFIATDALTNALVRFKDDFDPHYGGFGGAPKFPRPAYLSLLLRQGVRHRDQAAINMVLTTCEKMAAGGMYDQIGGGFARYSVDAKWLVPHFEKMLYDNAQLIELYLDAWLASGDRRHADVARGIIAYLLRDMTHPDGGFYSAEDADSEGQEGKFYCWTKAELEKLLAPEEFALVVRHYGITEKGNFEDHSHPNPLPNLNVLSIVDTELTPKESESLSSAKKKMFDARSKRIRPHLDDKVLSSWNGLMLGALARAGVVLGDRSVLQAAEKNLAFVQSKLWDAKTRTLYHRWRDGERDSVQLLDAYAFQLFGATALYEATLKQAYLEYALALAEAMISRFHDPKDGGFYQSAAASSDLILRVKEDYDGAEPSGNSVAALALLKLAAITDRKDLRGIAESSLKLFSQRLAKMPEAVPYMMHALAFSVEEPRRAVIAGEPESERGRDLLRAIHLVYQPGKVVLGTSGPVESFARTLPAKDGPVVYVCTGTACQPPTNDPANVKKYLSSGDEVVR